MTLFLHEGDSWIEALQIIITVYFAIFTDEISTVDGYLLRTEIHIKAL